MKFQLLYCCFFNFIFFLRQALVVPRVLSCLHVFCEACLDKKLIGEAGDSVTPETSIVCATCGQETKVWQQFIFYSFMIRLRIFIVIVRLINLDFTPMLVDYVR